MIFKINSAYFVSRWSYNADEAGLHLNKLSGLHLMCSSYGRILGYCTA